MHFVVNLSHPLSCPPPSGDDADLFLKDLRDVTEKILAGGEARLGDIRYS